MTSCHHKIQLIGVQLLWCMINASASKWEHLVKSFLIFVGLYLDDWFGALLFLLLLVLLCFEMLWNSFKEITKLVYSIIYHMQKGIEKDCPPVLFAGSYFLLIQTQVPMFALVHFWVELIDLLILSIFLWLLHSFHVTLGTISERVNYRKLDMILLGTSCFSTLPSTASAYSSLPLGPYFKQHKPLLYSKPSKFNSLVINGHRRM